MVINTLILISISILSLLSLSSSLTLLTKSSSVISPLICRSNYIKAFTTNSILYSSISTSNDNNNNINNNDNNKNDYIKPVINNIKGVIDRLKSSISRLGLNNKFKKEDFAKLGLFTLMSYGWVSNVSYITCLIISWIIHGREYGLSPLAPGQWKYFLTIYAALWAANNVLRPFRVTFALFLAPYFEKWVDSVEKRTKFKRATATAIVIFLFNICGTISYLLGGLVLATKIAKVPLLP